MTRLLNILRRNWPLRLAAIMLSVLLYAGVALSENTRTWIAPVPIEVLSPPPGGALLDLPGSVMSIRYRAPAEAAGQLANGSFRAAVDLSSVVPHAGGEPVQVRVRLLAIDPRVVIVGYDPQAVNVRIDQVISRTMPVTVDDGTPPEGLNVGPPQVEPAGVTVRGASSRVATVRSAIARVAVDGSGLNVDEEVELEAIDDAGTLVPGVEIDPQRVRVRLEVAREVSYATVPVVPQLVGTTAPGSRLRRVVVKPETVTVSGEAPAVERLTSVRTVPIDLERRGGDFVTDAALDVPSDMTVTGEATVRVSVTIERTRVSRTLEAGVSVMGARQDRRYTLSTPSVLVLVSGEAAILDALQPERIGARVAVGGLPNGRHELRVEVQVPDGVDVQSVTPAQLMVRVNAVEARPSPGPQATPSQAPADSPSASGIGSTTPVAFISPRTRA